MRKKYPVIWTWLLVSLLCMLELLPILLSLLLIGCQTGGLNSSDVKPSTPVQLKTITEDAKAAQVFTNKALVLIEDMQAGKVAVSLPAIHEQVAQAKTATDNVVQALPEAVKTAEADHTTVAKQEEKIKELQKADPQVATLNKIGITMLVLSIVAVGLGIWLNIPIARNGGFAGAGVAMAILALATYLHTIEWIIGLSVVAAGIGLLVYWILHRKVKNAQAGHDEFIGAMVASALPKKPADMPPVPDITLNTGAITM